MKWLESAVASLNSISGPLSQQAPQDVHAKRRVPSRATVDTCGTLIEVDPNFALA